METNFNFKSQIATDINQSERLLALGLKKETADMYYEGILGGELPKIMPHTSEMDYFQLWYSIIPAWSLHRLIEMMPMSIVEDKRYHEWWNLNVTPIAVIYRNQDDTNNWIGECMGRGLYNNLIDCIEWLIKEGYFNKVYLCQE